MRVHKVWLRRGTALVTAGVLAASAMTGCGSEGNTAQTNSGGKETSASQNPSSGETGSITYPIQDAGAFTFGMTLASAWSDRYDSFDELPLGKALEKNTGFDMEMVHVENKQAMNLLLASGELPDVISYNFALNYTGGESKAIQDGLIYPMSEEFVKENAPDYWNVISHDPELLQ